MESRSLRIRFHLKTDDNISPSEFVDLMNCVEEKTRDVVERETHALLNFLGLPSEHRFETMRRIHRVGRRMPLPAEVESVERGSWEVTVLIGGPALLWILKEYLHPIVKEAWDDSQIRENILVFLKEHVFREAHRTLEQKATEKPRQRNLEISGIQERLSGDTRHSEQVVLLERTRVIAVSGRERDLIEELVSRLGR